MRFFVDLDSLNEWELLHACILVEEWSHNSQKRSANDFCHVVLISALVSSNFAVSVFARGKVDRSQ